METLFPTESHMQHALVFPGQGSQTVGMGMQLAERFPVARQILDEADRALGFALSDIIANGPIEDLTKTDISQPAILTVSWMAAKVLKETSQNFRFNAVAGLSLGEYTALIAAEVLTFADAVKLVRLRGQAMQRAADAVPSGMVVLIGTEEAGAQKLCDAVRQSDVLSVANLNSPGQVVISGHKTACDRAVAAAKEHGIKRAMPLPVAGAFHSALMAPAAKELEAALAKTTFADAKVDVYHNVDGKPNRSGAAMRDILIRQLTQPVRWSLGIQNMSAAGITNFLELGPGNTISGMIKRINEGATVLNISNPDEAFAVAAKLQ